MDIEKKMPILAICYDFDKTLSPNDMQAQGYIQKVYNGDVADFWRECQELSKNNEMDGNLAYMYKMVQEAHGKIIFNKSMLEEYGAKVALFPGVEDWFERIRNYGLLHGVLVEHYIISSGLREMIEGTSVARAGAFKKIYASSFMYDAYGVAVWPAQAVNYTNKTQFLFRIEKGVLDVNDHGVNDYYRPEDIRVPFRNMVYIGDSDTDIPCMKLVNSNGGYAVGVYDAETADKTKVYKMMRENRIRYFAPADYSEGSELDSLLRLIIERTASNELLEDRYLADRNETHEVDRRKSEQDRLKADLTVALESSHSFARTHDVIAKLRNCGEWSAEEAERLIQIAVSNNQVFFVLRDGDVGQFYSGLLERLPELSENAQKVKRAIESTR